MKYKTKDSQYDTAIDYFVSRYPLIIDETTKFLWNNSVSSSDMTRKYGIFLILYAKYWFALDDDHGGDYEVFPVN